MITAKELHNRFDIEWGMINVQHETTIGPREKDLFLNRALDLFIFECARLASHNKTAKAFIEPLEVNNVEAELVNDFTEYSVLIRLKDDYFRLIRARLTGKKKDREGNYVKDDITLRPVQPHEYDRLRHHTNTRPNFNWRETIYTHVGKGIEVATNKEFEVDEVVYSYYKKHPRIAGPSMSTDGKYLGLDEKMTEKDQGLLIDKPHGDSTILSFALLFAAGVDNDFQTFNTKKDELLNAINLVNTKIR